MLSTDVSVSNNISGSQRVSLSFLRVSSGRKCSQVGGSGCEGPIFLFQKHCCTSWYRCSVDV